MAFSTTVLGFHNMMSFAFAVTLILSMIACVARQMVVYVAFEQHRNYDRMVKEMTENLCLMLAIFAFALLASFINPGIFPGDDKLCGMASTLCFSTVSI